MGNKALTEITEKTMLVSNCTPANVLREGSAVKIAKDFSFERKINKRKEKFEGKILVSTPPIMKQQIYPKLTEYETLVCDAIYTIYAQETQFDGIDYSKELCFTAYDVFKELPGGNSKPNDRQIDLINKVINKLLMIRISVEMSGQMPLAGSDQKTSHVNLRYCDYLLNAASIEIDIRHRKIKASGYKLFHAPVLYKYQTKFGVLLKINKELLRLKKIRDGELTD